MIPEIESTIYWNPDNFVVDCSELCKKYCTYKYEVLDRMDKIMRIVR